jgi:hypothetical protein
MELKRIQSKIHEIRGQKVMLDSDIAELYEVETRVLNQAVKRNIDLFPKDFLFQLSATEWKELTMSSQFVMTSPMKRPKSSLPLAFTEHGIAMLANVLKSKRARQTSVAIVRAFIALKQLALSHKELTSKIRELEKKYNKNFKDVHEAINYLLQKDKIEIAFKDRKRTGLKQKEEN